MVGAVGALLAEAGLAVDAEDGGVLEVVVQAVGAVEAGEGVAGGTEEGEGQLAGLAVPQNVAEVVPERAGLSALVE